MKEVMEKKIYLAGLAIDDDKVKRIGSGLAVPIFTEAYGPARGNWPQPDGSPVQYLKQDVQDAIQLIRAREEAIAEQKKMTQERMKKKAVTDPGTEPEYTETGMRKNSNFKTTGRRIAPKVPEEAVNG